MALHTKVGGDGPDGQRPARRAGALVVGAVVMLCGLVLAGCGVREVGSREQAKAAELQTRIAALGVEVPRGELVSLYGDDGGYLCAAAAGKGDLDQVALTGHRFALRKLEVYPQDVGYVRAVVGVYCPDEQRRLDAYLEGLKQRGVGS